MTPSHPVLEAARSCQDWLVDLRQQLHRLPELSYREQATAERVKTELSAMGVPWEAVGEHGVVATVTGQHSRAMVALRADMDALPIQEQNEHLPYRSQVPGVMHACGHDGHTAMLMAAAQYIAQEVEFSGTLNLIFQPVSYTHLTLPTKA